MRRHLLQLLCLLVVLPIVLIVGAAGSALFNQEKRMRTMAESYAMNLVETLAGRNESEKTGESPRHPGRNPHKRGHGHGVFSRGLGVPGWVAQFYEDGSLMRQSPGAQIVPQIQKVMERLKEQGEGAATLSIRQQGHNYAVAVIFDERIFYIAAISWQQLFALPAYSGILRPGLLILPLGIALAAFYALWKWLVCPLRGLAGEMRSLKLGREIPHGGITSRVLEMEELRVAFVNLALLAVEQEKLKRVYVNDIVRTQEGERLRIAQDLHDGALQTVSAISQRVQLALKSIEKPVIEKDRVTAHLLAAQEAAESSIQEMRAICDILSPPWISLGLVSTLEEMGDRLSRNYGRPVIINATTKAIPELSPDRILALCRIVQEAVSNAFHHGQSDVVTVDVTADGQVITVRISDNGCGFEGEADPQKLRIAGHRGISGMAERISMFGGIFAIHSIPGQGTEVTVTLSSDSEKGG